MRPVTVEVVLNKSKLAFLNGKDIQELLGCSHSVSDKLIKEIKGEIKKEGYTYLPGYVPTTRVFNKLGLDVNEYRKLKKTTD